MVEYPPPSWQKTLDPNKYLKVKREERKGLFELEIIHPKEDFNGWRRKYSVVGEKPVAGNVFDTFKNLILVMADVCEKGQFKLQPVSETGTRIDFLTFCGNVPNVPVLPFYSGDLGEIGVHSMHRVGNTLVWIYQNWRGGAFDLSQKHTWPVTSAELDMMIKRFELIRVTPLSVS